MDLKYVSAELLFRNKGDGVAFPACTWNKKLFHLPNFKEFRIFEQYSCLKIFRKIDDKK